MNGAAAGGSIPPDEPAAPPRQHAPLWHWALWLALVYAAVALLSMAIARQPGSIATIWFGNALGVAALAHRPRRDWPLLLAAVGAANVAANLLRGQPAARSSRTAAAHRRAAGWPRASCRRTCWRSCSAPGGCSSRACPSAGCARPRR